MSRRHAPRNRSRKSASAVIQALERRTMLTGVTFNWLGGAGSWTDPSHWSHNPPPAPEQDRSLPGGEDTVAIGPGAGTATIPTGIPVGCKALNLSANLRLEIGSNLNLFGGDLNITDQGAGAVVTMVGGLNTRIIFNNGTSPAVPKTLNIGGNGTITGASGGGLIVGGGTGTLSDRLVIGAGVTIRGTGSSAITISEPNLTNFGTIVSDASTTGLGGVSITGNTTAPTFINQGTIRTTNGGNLRIGAVAAGTWHNSGLIEINGGTLRLGGTFKQFNLGNYTRVGGTIQIVQGKLQGNLLLDDHAGSWELNGATLEGARITRTGNNGLIFNLGGVFDRCSLGFDVTLTGSSQSLQIKNGLTLTEDAAIRLNNSASLNVNGTQTIGGKGQILFGGGNIAILAPAPHSLTFESGIVVRTDTASGNITGQPADRVIVKGQLSAATSTLSITPGFCDVSGQLMAGSGATLSLSSALDLQSTASLVLGPTGTISASSSFTGASTTSARTRSGGVLRMSGSSQKQLEVMSQDRGAVTDGYRDNFGLGRLTLNGGAIVNLQDVSENAAGSGAEALYLDTLIVPAGSTLNLNGLKLYARLTSIQGTITGGAITNVPDSGPILLGLPTSGSISVAAQLDDWTFYGRQGQTIAAVMNTQSTFDSPGSPATLAPTLALGRLSLLKADGTVLGFVEGSNASFFLADQVLPEDGVYRLRAQAPPSDPNRTGNYNLAAYDVTVDKRAYLLNTTAGGAIEAPFVKDQWTFSLEAGQQIQFDLIAAYTSGLQFTLQGPGGFTAFNNVTNDTAVITIPGGKGGNYVLTAKGSADQVGAYSFAVRDGSVTPLTLGATFNGTLPGSGASRWFSMTLPDPGELLLTLDDATNADRNELYLRRGELPTRSEYDYRLSSSAADGTLYVPDAAGGDWFALVYGDHVPAASQYTLRAEYSDLRIESITPDRYGVNNMMTMTFFGGGFVPGTTAKLISGGTTINAASVTIDSFTQITATFNLNGAPQAAFDVRVENNALNFTLPGAFQTLPNAPAHLEMSLQLSGIALRTSTTTQTLEYANTGNVAMPAPLMIVQSADPQGDQHPVLSLDASRILEDFWGTKLPPGVSERVMILGSGAVPGVLNPGERIKVPIKYLGEKAPIVDNDQLLQLEARCVESGSPEANNPIDWSKLKDDLKPPTVPSPIWDQVYANLTGSLTTVEDYAAVLRADADYLGQLGLHVLDIDDLWNFEVLKALGGITAFPTLSSAIDAQVPAPGVSLSFTRRFNDGVLGRNLEGPFGFGWDVPWFATLSRDANDDILAINTPGGTQRIFVRDGRGGATSSKYFSGTGDSSSMTRISTGIFQLTDPGGNMTRFRADGKIDYVQDIHGNRDTAGYNGAGQLVTLTHTSGGSIFIGYNGAGHISRVTDSLGHSNTYSYDASGNHLLSATADDGTVLAYTYDTGSNVLVTHSMLTESIGGSTRIFTYHAQGRIASISLAGGTQQGNVSFNSGRVTLTDSAGSAQLYFDHRGRLAKVTNARGFSTTTKYDDDNNPTQITLPDGSTQKYEWCDCGSLVSLTNELGKTSTFDYDDTIDRLTTVTDAKGNVSRFTYDASGNPLLYIRADGTTEGASNYSAAGLAQTFTNSRAQNTTYAYNAAGQVTARTVTAGSTSYTYDSRGRVSVINISGNQTTLTYDTTNDGDRLKRITYPDTRFVEYDYDADGRQIAMRDQTGFTTRYDCDASGRLFRLRDTAGATLTTYTYDAAGRITRIDNSNGTFTTYGYDAAGNVLSVQNFRSVGVLNSRFVYTYDSRDRRITEATSDGTWTYGYDRASQLTSATLNSTNASIPNQSMQITYDDAGNREFMTLNGSLIDYGTSALNQYTSVDGVGYAYDADGNLTFDGTRSYAYDELNHLTSVTDGTNTQTFGYNALGRRSTSTLNGVRTDYLVTPDLAGTVLGEFNSGATLLAHNVIAGAVVGRTSGAGAVNFLDFDAAGSTAGMSDATGAYINNYAYDPFGRVLLSNQTLSNPYQFIGAFGVRAETTIGLSHMGLRDYAPSLGRFTTLDPLRLQADLNAYRYASNSPVMNIDPTGLFVGAVASEVSNRLGYGVVVGAAGTKASGDEITLDGVLVGIALDQGFAYPGSGGFGAAVSLSMNPEVFGGIIQGVCGLKRQRDFGTSNAGEARQLAALGFGPKGAGGASVDEGCQEGKPGSGDANMGVGDRCAYAEASLRHSFDPNDKIPPLGFGPDNRVAIEKPVEYVIDFENVGPGSVDRNGDLFPTLATAPAQRISISDKLSSNLDWRTAQFTEFSFGDTIIPVTDGFGGFQTQVDAELNGVKFVVQIDAEIDLATGILSVIFQAIDPITGLPPDPFTGVLPPEDGTGNGIGYLRYSVNPLSNVTDGTAIRNIAQIRFDSNDVIPTNQINPLDPTQGTDPALEALVTIDALPPTIIGSPAFQFDAPTPRISVQFSEDVRDRLSLATAAIENLTTSTAIPAIAMTYDAATNTATLELARSLPAGDYRLVISSADVADGVGHSLGAPVTLDFFFLNADANRDRAVDLTDFTILAANFNTIGKTFSQGNFDYDPDGKVDLTDFTILAANFNKQLAASAEAFNSAAPLAPAGLRLAPPPVAARTMDNELLEPGKDLESQAW